MTNINLEKFISKIVEQTGAQNVSSTKPELTFVLALETKKSHRYIDMHNNGDNLKIQFLERIGPGYRTQSAVITKFNSTPEKRMFVQGLQELLKYRALTSPENEGCEFTKTALNHMPPKQSTYRSIQHVSKVLYD